MHGGMDRQSMVLSRVSGTKNIQRWLSSDNEVPVRHSGSVALGVPKSRKLKSILAWIWSSIIGGKLYRGVICIVLFFYCLLTLKHI